MYVGITGKLLVAVKPSLASCHCTVTEISQERDDRVIELQEEDPAIIDCIIQFMYTEE